MPNILITGASRGLGLEFVRQYAEDGADVWACCRDPKSAKDLLALQDQHKNKIRIYDLDVRSPSAIQKTATEIQDVAIDVLINNAGIYGGQNSDQRFGSLNEKLWNEVFLVNTIAPLKVAEFFFQHVLRGAQKKMVFITSKMGSLDDNTSGGAYLYRSSKAALNMAVKSLSVDVREQGVAVVLLHPGWVQTDMGGPNALITPKESISGMRKVITALSLEKTGSFFDYDGEKIAW